MLDFQQCVTHPTLTMNDADSTGSPKVKQWEDPGLQHSGHCQPWLPLQMMSPPAHLPCMPPACRCPKARCAPLLQTISLTSFHLAFDFSFSNLRYSRRSNSSVRNRQISRSTRPMRATPAMVPPTISPMLGGSGHSVEQT